MSSEKVVDFQNPDNLACHRLRIELKRCMLQTKVQIKSIFFHDLFQTYFFFINLKLFFSRNIYDIFKKISEIS